MSLYPSGQCTSVLILQCIFNVHSQAPRLRNVSMEIMQVETVSFLMWVTSRVEKSRKTLIACEHTRWLRTWSEDAMWLISGGQTFHTLSTEHVYSWLNMCKMFLFGASQLQLCHAHMRKDTRLSSLAMFTFWSEGVTEWLNEGSLGMRLCGWSEEGATLLLHNSGTFDIMGS